MAKKKNKKIHIYDMDVVQKEKSKYGYYPRLITNTEKTEGFLYGDIVAQWRFL